MSYCRKTENDSDVYVISVKDGWECLGCPSKPLIPSPWADKMLSGSTFCSTRQNMLDHLLKHREEGHRVPERALERLRKEIGEEPC